ncbi:hypothetical protein FPF71_12790 [Algibacter amylolyticus]|uniref:Uncharacterized protein n=1 Tax=Algibacter amylolyticus TaxID=1608400 RepID=A0A5M7B1S4_9FLAO|nr:hypothetical protein [Algibacter amylolyticus]KAA5823573.1 hypothetical protein F2B50_12790 [Algibacter amylolyticus]MBB5267730.1 hypothetical protein [Algibacter amylolyticus]TSJ74061.1 hypothetical protein FPF71_12790 [Algibacter amylolyticus]
MADCIDCRKEVKVNYKRCYSCNNEYQNNRKVIKLEKNEPSEGELFLQEYFESEGIRYRAEVPILKLNNDSKSHRVADFYLPYYGLYVEFLGKWFVSEKEKDRYREKKRVYQENDIPCIFLYPENLGIIDFILPSRAIKEFKKHSLTKELWLFRSKFLWLYKQENLVLIAVLIAILISGNFIWQEDVNLILILISIICYQIYSIIKFYNKKLK